MAEAMREMQGNLWRKQQAVDGISADLAGTLEAARRASVEERSKFAEALMPECKVEQLRSMRSMGNVEDVSTVYTFGLMKDQVPLGLLRANVWPKGRTQLTTAVLFGPQCDPALPLDIYSEHIFSELGFLLILILLFFPPLSKHIRFLVVVVVRG